MGRMTNRDRRDQSFERAAGILTREQLAIADDAREAAAAAQRWIVMAQFDGLSNFYRERNGRGLNVWTMDPRAAASVCAFDSESEAGIFIAGRFSAREIDQFAIQPTAFGGGR